MDLGIAGRKAIVCASSRGLGRACAYRLAEAGCEVVVNGRHDLASVPCRDQTWRDDIGLFAQRRHPGEFRPDRFARVVVGAVYPQHDRFGVVHQVRCVLGQAEQPQRRIGVSVVRRQGGARIPLVIGRQS